MGEPRTASPTRDPQDALIGRLIDGKFEVESLIGRGENDRLLSGLNRNAR